MSETGSFDIKKVYEMLIRKNNIIRIAEVLEKTKNKNIVLNKNL